MVLSKAKGKGEEAQLFRRNNPRLPITKGCKTIRKAKSTKWVGMQNCKAGCAMMLRYGLHHVGFAAKDVCSMQRVNLARCWEWS